MWAFIIRREEFWEFTLTLVENENLAIDNLSFGESGFVRLPFYARERFEAFLRRRFYRGIKIVRL
jgi:hypothetical protein